MSEHLQEIAAAFGAAAYTILSLTLLAGNGLGFGVGGVDGIGNGVVVTWQVVGRVALPAHSPPTPCGALQQFVRSEVIAPLDPDPAPSHALAALQDCVILPIEPCFEPVDWHEPFPVHESVTCPTFPLPRPRSRHESSKVHDCVMSPTKPP